MVLSWATLIGFLFPSATPSVASKTTTSPLPGRMSRLGSLLLRGGGAQVRSFYEALKPWRGIQGQSAPGVAALAVTDLRSPPCARCPALPAGQTRPPLLAGSLVETLDTDSLVADSATADWPCESAQVASSGLKEILHIKGLTQCLTPEVLRTRRLLLLQRWRSTGTTGGTSPPAQLLSFFPFSHEKTGKIFLEFVSPPKMGKSELALKTGCFQTNRLEATHL